MAKRQARDKKKQLFASNISLQMSRSQILSQAFVASLLEIILVTQLLLQKGEWSNLIIINSLKKGNFS